MGESDRGSAQRRRGAPLKVLEDRTPLGGHRIDVAARIAWLLRTSRLATPATRDLPQYAMVDRLREAGFAASRSWVHRLEAGELRSGRGAEAYEQVLGLRPGRLRAAIDLACRATPDSLPDSDPGDVVDDVVQLSQATEAVLEDGVTGWQWFVWARQFSRPEVRGLRASVASDAITRLCGEVGRAVGTAYDTRYEALASLCGGPYGGLVLAAAAEYVADPHAQAIFDVVSAATEVANPEAYDRCLAMLADERPLVVQAGVNGVENLLAHTSGRRTDWNRIVTAAVAAFRVAEEGQAAWHSLGHLLRLVPSSRLQGIAIGRPLPPAPRVGSAQRTSGNEHWSRCVRLARTVTDEVGIPEQPMLARLLFDVLVGWSVSAAFPSARLLAALPFAATVTDRAIASAGGEQDPALRTRMLQRLTWIGEPSAPEELTRWLFSEDPEARTAALALLAHAGVQPPSELLRDQLAGETTARRRALYAAGMSRHPLLAELVADADTPESVRGAARWWLRMGGRISED